MLHIREPSTHFQCAFVCPDWYESLRTHSSINGIRSSWDQWPMLTGSKSLLLFSSHFCSFLVFLLKEKKKERKQRERQLEETRGKVRWVRLGRKGERKVTGWGKKEKGREGELRKPDLCAQSKIREIISSFAAFSMRTRPPEKQCDGLHQNGFHRLLWLDTWFPL